jgi:hypothetical protein
VLQREQWRAHQLLGLGLERIGQRIPAAEELEKGVRLLELRIGSLPRTSERSKARRESIDAYRSLAAVLLEDDPSGKRALQVWLAAHGASDAPDLVYLALDRGYGVWTGNGARFYRLDADRARIRLSVSRLLDGATDPHASVDAIRREGRLLFTQLLPREILPQHDGVLSVLPDAEIASLPFDLLVDDAGRWVGESRAFVFSSSPRSAGAGCTAPRLDCRLPRYPGKSASPAG